MQKSFRNLSALALVVAVLVLTLVAPLSAATTYRFKGYDAWIIYTLPVPPGGQVQKERVQVADDIPREALLPTVTAMWKLIYSLQSGMTDAGSPMAGWAPFAGGVDVQPQYEIITTP